MYDPIIRIDNILGKGDKGETVRQIQEWLCFQGFGLKMDGDFGAITQAGIRMFQKKENLEASGKVDQVTLDWLQSPMISAMSPIVPIGNNLPETIVMIARNHLEQRPVEIGGQNMGPWVRSYMKGNQGADFPWCAGFASTIIALAAKQLEISVPFPYTMSCDTIQKFSLEHGMFVSENDINKRKKIHPGSLFLVRKTKTDWVHTGIVEAVEDSFIVTIEGNSNDEGDREGREVCRRLRSYKSLDFVSL